MARFFILCLAGLAGALLAGCATMADSTEQQVELHTIVENREVAGVGCILANKAGRWFVTAPGRITITRSSGPLSIDCARQGVGSSRELVDSRFNTGRMIGNLVVTGGLGYLVDRRSGAGFAYPSTLTVIMSAPPARPVDDAVSDNRVF